MPLVCRHIRGGTTLLLWEIAESERQLCALVNAQDRLSAGRFRSPGRRIEHLAWRAALREIVGAEAEVHYDEVGRPYIGIGIAGADVGTETGSKLEGGNGLRVKGDADAGATNGAALYTGTVDGEAGRLFVSAAHTRGMAAVVVSDRPCAVDIERATRDMRRAVPRFISADERALPGSAAAEFPVTMWCAKEALYKFAGQQGLDFLADIEVADFQIASAGSEAEPEAGHETGLEAGRMMGRAGAICGIPLYIMRFGDYIVVYI